MKIKVCLLTLTIAAFGALACGTQADAAPPLKFQTQRGMERCIVSDSTGSPLNVRTSPNGKRVVTKLKNGTDVFIEDYSSDAQDREWVKVRLTGKRVNKGLGWVLREFLVCE